jgi:arylsulfatase A-like enzyme
MQRALITTVTCLAVILLFSAVAQAADAPPSGKPNIVLIISDDQGWGDYSFMGHPHVRTPHLDQLAAQSLMFPRGYATSSLCCPSLASILTGLYPHQNKITSNDPPKPPDKRPAELARDPNYLRLRSQMVERITQVPTLPRLLHEQGYVSLQTGKWWQGHYRTGGFTQGMTHGDPNKGGRHGDAGLAIGRETMQPIYTFVEQAQKDGKPFFVWYAPMLPHQPHNPPERFLARYKEKAPSAFVARYWAMVEWFDETCGQLLDFLDQKGLTENTIVVYVTDNGWIQNPNANAPIRSKLTQYDAGHRTPILIRWPGKVKPQKSEQLASAVDLVATLLHAVGLKPTAQMQGVNLLDAEAVARRPAIFGECFTHDAVDINDPGSSLRYRWVIAGEWKLIVPNPENVPQGEVELYHVAADPSEQKNLAREQPDQVEALQKKLDAWWTPEKPGAPS